MSYKPTPRETWQRFISPNSTLDRLIMNAVEQVGEEGVICQDIETQISRDHQAVSANLSRLAKRGLIEENGYGRTRAGHRAKKWRICDQSKSNWMVPYPGADMREPEPEPGADASKAKPRWTKKPTTISKL